MVLNAIVGLPTIIKELEFIPEVFRDYCHVKINEGFCYLYQCLMLLTIKKNELLVKMYIPMVFGYIASPLIYVMAGIEEIENAIETAMKAFDAAYSKLMVAIQASAATGLRIPAESYSWICSPRSYASPLPETNPDAGKLFVELPGVKGLDLTMLKPLLPSALQNINISAIDTYIQKIMPPLTTVDYFMEPEMFKTRYALSNQARIVLNLRQQLEKILSAGPDYLPKFENLLPVTKKTYTTSDGTLTIPVPNIGYTYFLLGLMDSWAPHSKSLVGSYMHPEV